MNRSLRLSKSEFRRISRENSAFSAALAGISGVATGIIRAVATAAPVVRNLRDAIEIRFEGARLATLNDLLAMSVQERRRYRVAWHKLVHDTALAEFNGRPPVFATVRITLTRFGPRELDPDAIIPKAPINGLRYSGFIPEDTVAVVQSLSLMQALGDYAVVMRLSKPLGAVL